MSLENADSRPPGPGRPYRLLAAAGLVWLTALAAQAQRPPGRPTGPRLTEHWVQWATDLAPLMSEEEREAFFALDADTDRESFARAFWRSRGAEAAERWGRNTEDVLLLRLESARRRAALLLGKPSRTELFPRCGGLRRVEAWSWETPVPGWKALGDAAPPAVMILVRATSFDARSLAPWQPGDVSSLTYAPHTTPDLETALEQV